MDPKLLELLKTLIFEKFFHLVLVFAVTSLLWMLIVRALELLARWTERYRLFVVAFIPWVKTFLVVTAAWYIIFGIMKLPQDQLVYVLAVLIVAVGISSRDVVGSVFSYFSIVWNKPFQIGDRVKIGNVYGEVIDIGLACTKLRTPGDSVATIPNSAVTSTECVNTNYAALHSMAEIDLFLASAEDPQVVKKILWEAAVTSKFFYPEMPVIVLVAQLPYCTRYRVKAYTYDTRAEFKFMSDVTETAKREFTRRGMRYAPLPVNEAGGRAVV